LMDRVSMGDIVRCLSFSAVVQMDEFVATNVFWH